MTPAEGDASSKMYYTFENEAISLDKSWLGKIGSRLQAKNRRRRS